MRGRALVPVIMAMAGLAGCHKAADLTAADTQSAAAPPSRTAGAGGTAAPTMINATAPQLAYAFAYTLSLPAGQIETTLNHDQQACAAAGPTMCQLVGSTLSRQGGSIADGHLDLRAAPAWIASFRSGIAGEAKGAGGRVEAATVQSEDLSRSIVDTEAAIRAKTTLRDRIEKLLAERPGKLSDVMDAEKELASVQGDLDATHSELAVMRTRVATSTLSIDYHAIGVAAPDGVLSPLRTAANGFLGNMVMVFAGLLQVLSILLPFAIVGAPVAWLIWRFRRKTRNRTELLPKATPSAE